MQVMKALGQVPTEEEVAAMVRMIDVDGDGEVEFEEFLILMVKQLKKEMNAEEELVEVFNMFDTDGDGQISPEDLCARFQGLGDPISLEEAQEMIRCSDVDVDGYFNFTEFVKVMMYDTENKGLADPSIER